MESNKLNIQPPKEHFTLSEVRKELKVPLIVAKKLIVWGEVEAIKALNGHLVITKKELLKAKKILKNPRKRFSVYLRALGPGLITGAADDDPGGIGTYSSVAAQFGLSILWMAFWLLPFMLAIQEVCARIGIVTNRGLARVLLKHYKKKIVVLATLILIVANVVNIGADLNVMSASLSMLIDINFYVAVILFGAIIIFTEVFINYRTYNKYLKWLVLSVFAYVITGILIHPDWIKVLKFSFIPSIQFTREYFFAMVAVFGTTITPYLFFWQTSAEVEEGKRIHKKRDTKWIYGHIRKMRTDVATGMILANVIFYFIIITGAHVFYDNDIFNIETANQAAQILRPFAGEYAYLIFTLGIIGTGMLAIPVLAGSGAYAIAEIMRWQEGLDLKFSKSKRFYFVIIISILIGMSINFFQLSPIKALYYSAFLNGIIALPLIVLIMIVGNDKKIMGDETHPKIIWFLGWLTVFFMSFSMIGMALLYLI